MDEVFQESETMSPLIALRERWASMGRDERTAAFTRLPGAMAEDFLLSLRAEDQGELICSLPEGERRIWIRVLPPDDLADVIQSSDVDRNMFLSQLDAPRRKEVTALLAYAEDEAGGLMNPRFPRVRPKMRVDEALAYLRMQASNLETMRYCYVLGSDQSLLGVVSLRQIFQSDSGMLVQDIMRTSFISATDTMSQEETKNLISASGLMAIPVLDAAGHMKGIVTVDDIVDVVEEEATEDIHRLGGSEVLDAPYLQVGLLTMVRKRAVWLVVLFIGEMFTATAMGYYEHEIARAVVLALFIPLIISSGGNSGSQASTLVVRAMALGEVRIGDWWKVLSRELIVGTSLGLILGVLGLARIVLWPGTMSVYGEHYALIGLVVGVSVAGVALWGSLCGSMLPFLLRRLKLDPATASAPFVATIVDVSGLVLYFSVAHFILSGVLL